MNEKICKSCGEKNGVDAVFCRKCGKPLETVEQNGVSSATPIVTEKRGLLDKVKWLYSIPVILIIGYFGVLNIVLEIAAIVLFLIRLKRNKKPGVLYKIVNIVIGILLALFLLVSVVDMTSPEISSDSGSDVMQESTAVIDEALIAEEIEDVETEIAEESTSIKETEIDVIEETTGVLINDVEETFVNEIEETVDFFEDYILYNSNEKYLTVEDVSGLSGEEIRLAINEIYARHGRIYQTEDLNSYFSSKEWYNPVYSAEEFAQIEETELNDFEKVNIEFLADIRDGNIAIDNGIFEVEDYSSEGDISDIEESVPIANTQGTMVDGSTHGVLMKVSEESKLFNENGEFNNIIIPKDEYVIAIGERIYRKDLIYESEPYQQIVYKEYAGFINAYNVQSIGNIEGTVDELKMIDDAEKLFGDSKYVNTIFTCPYPKQFSRQRKKALDFINEKVRTTNPDEYIMLEYQDWRKQYKQSLNGVSKYVGDIKNNKPNGYGAIISAGVCSYVGEFKDGMYHGYGVKFDSDGIKEEGEYKKGELSGDAIRYYNISEESESLLAYLRMEWEVWNGIGNNPLLFDFPILIPTVQMEGEFDNDEAKGNVKWYYRNYGKTDNPKKEYGMYNEGENYGALYYEGEVKGETLSGKGTEYFLNGTIKYKGEYKNGEYDGKGTLYNEDGSERYSGKFKRGDIA